MSKISKNIIQEAIKQEVLKENPFSSALAGVKGAIGGVKGTFQNMGANYRLSNIGSQMDQYAKKSKKAWDINSKKARKQAEKLQTSKNTDVARAGKNVERQLDKADQEVFNALNFVEKGVARTMMAAADGRSSSIEDDGKIYGARDLENALKAKGINPNLIGKKEYIKVVEYFQVLAQMGGIPPGHDFARAMVKKGVDSSRLGKREYGVEIINWLKDMINFQHQQGQQPQAQMGQRQQPQVPQAAAQNQRMSPQAAQNQRPQTNPVPSKSKAGHAVPGVYKRGDFKSAGQVVPPLSQMDTSDLPSSSPKAMAAPQQQTPSSAISSAAAGGDDSQAFNNVWNKVKSWSGQDLDKVHPRIKPEEPKQLDVMNYGDEGQRQRVTTGGGEIQNVAQSRKTPSVANRDEPKQIPVSSRFTPDQLAQTQSREVPYSIAEPVDPSIPPPVPPEAKKVKLQTKVAQDEEEAEPIPLTQRKEAEPIPLTQKRRSDLELYRDLLAKDAEKGKFKRTRTTPAKKFKKDWEDLSGQPTPQKPPQKRRQKRKSSKK